MKMYLHAAYLYKDGKVVTLFEDIGRHNALDKIIGYIYLNNIKSEDCIVFTTGRVPVDMVRKAIYAKLGALVSKAVPTVDAVNLAKEYNLNLICRAWQDSFQIFNKSN
jgi:FdhD protein